MDKNTSQFCARGVTTVMLLSVLSACGGSAATTPTVKPPTTTSATPTAVTPESTILAEMSARNTALLEKYTPVVYTDLTIIAAGGGYVT